MGFLVDRNNRVTKAPINCVSVTERMKPGQLFNVDVVHVGRPIQLVSPQSQWRVQMYQTSQAYGFEGETDGGEREGQQWIMELGVQNSWRRATAR